MMVAYSFKKRFVAPIQVGLGLIEQRYNGLEPPSPAKRQTIRLLGKRRHARPGETLQLYTAMRTKQCAKIGEARCVDVRDIVLTFGKLSGVSIGGTHLPDGSQQRQECYMAADLDVFARKDGFRHWREMVDFWDKEHGSLSEFTGVLIEWEPLQ